MKEFTQEKVSRENRLKSLSKFSDRDISSVNDLSMAEADVIIEHIDDGEFWEVVNA